MSLDLQRLRRADRIVAVGAIVLLVSIFFLKWFGISIDGIGADVNGWDSLTITRWLELLLIAAGLGMACLSAGGGELDGPLSLSVLVAGLGTLVTVLILYRTLISHPHQGEFNRLDELAHNTARYSAQLGAYIGMLAAAAITYGGYEALRAESAT